MLWLVGFSKARTGNIGKFRIFLNLFFFVQMPTEEFLSAPGDEGWEVILNKTCILDTLSVEAYTNKTYLES